LKEVEKAALFCQAELERSKGGGLVLKQPQEKTVFLAEVGYPFWLVPWEELNLVVDGLGVAVHHLQYNTIADAKAFTENVEISSKTLETYMDFLTENVNYFQPSTNQKEIVLNGFITDPDLLNEFKLYLSEATQTTAALSEIVMLTPTVEESAMLPDIQELNDLKMRFREDLNILYATLKLLNKTTNAFAKTIRTKMKADYEELREKIKKEEGIAKPKVQNIREEYDAQITQLTKNFEKQATPLRQEKVKLEKLQEQTLTKIDRCKIEIKTSKAGKDNVSEKKWKEKLDESKKELNDVKKRIKEAEAKIKETEDQKQAEVFRLRSESEASVKEAMKNVLELEAARDAKTQVHKQGIDQLKQLTSTIIEQIDKNAKMRETDLAGLEKLGISQRFKNNMLAYVPFYLACYQSESKRRYFLFPPSVASTVGLATKLKGALGRAKIKDFLNPRFRNLTQLLYQFPTLLEQNAVLEREIVENGTRVDLLKSKAALESVKSGLDQLKMEGWFSEKEYEAFKQMLT
jgi:DNA repair exonuclease SbcCD ATPase subunit